MTAALRWADRALGAVSAAGAYAASVGVTLIMLGTSLDVLRRAVSGQSVPGVIEGSEVLLVIAAFLGLGFTQRVGAHVATSVVTDRLPPRLSALVRIVGLLAAALFLAWIADATSEVAWESYQDGEYRFGLLQVPIWPGRIAIAVGFVLLLLEIVRDLVIQTAQLIRGERPPDEDQAAGPLPLLVPDPDPATDPDPASDAGPGARAEGVSSR